MQHIAIIPDGNRRWAKENKLSVLEGHKFVAEQIFPALIKKAIELQIPYLTFWCFSRENWHRAQEEVDGLLDLFRRLGMTKLINDAHQIGARVQIIGNRQDFDVNLQKEFTRAETKTAQNSAITVVIALSYSGRDEIIRAQQKMLLANPDLKPDQITEEFFAQYLDTKDIPDPDLIIRTSGEQRLSGLFPWQATYSEFYFTNLKMPEFGPDQFAQAIEDYHRRQRRFGK